MSEIDSSIESLRTHISGQNQVIHDLQTKLEKIEDKLERTTSVLHQLVSGLFNHNTQQGCLMKSINILYGHELHHESDPDKLGSWGTLPTTRQGDALESKMDQVMSNISELFNNQDKLQRQFDVVTAAPALGHAKVDDRLAKLEARLASVNDEFCDTKYVVKEIASGLFNMETQRGAWKNIRELFWHDDVFETMSKKDLQMWSQTTSKWKSLPTTRQGDECEERLDKIEAKMRMMAKALCVTHNC